MCVEIEVPACPRRGISEDRARFERVEAPKCLSPAGVDFPNEWVQWQGPRVRSEVQHCRAPLVVIPTATHRKAPTVIAPHKHGAAIPAAPADLVSALGKGDKKIYVVPSLELVVVRHGEEADASAGNPLAVSAFDEQWWRKLKPAFRY